MDLGIVFGLNYAFIGKKWVLNLGGGFSALLSENGETRLNDEGKETGDHNWYFVPHFQTKFDCRLFGDVSGRVVYRADLFLNNKFDAGFNYPWPHDMKVVDNIGLGIVLWI
jgi:hypothetical protein